MGRWPGGHPRLPGPCTCRIKEGNVWYFGEDTAEYEDGEIVSTAGAWEAGVDGALPGIAMEADRLWATAIARSTTRGGREDLAEVVEIA